MANTETSASGVVSFSEGGNAAAQAGILVWNYLNRLDSEDAGVQSANYGMFGAISIVGGLVTAGVNLFLGGRNMKHNSDENTHSLTLKVNNFTPYTLVARMLERVDNASLKSCIASPGDTLEIELGTRNYAGASNKDKGPSVYFTLTDGTHDVPVEVKFTDTTDSSSGQIRVRLVNVGATGAEDQSGAKVNTEMKHPFYTYAPTDGGPGFMVTSTPVSDGHADLSVTFMA